MNIGMLWYDNDQKTEINLKIQRAASYYQNKYGTHPNICFVHPSMLVTNSTENDEKGIKSGEILIKPSFSVLPNHFWIGVNGSLEKSLS
ncbi:MAG TPA: hypothetical protein VLA49_06170 [Anaerolineales bacterium]|nr:hypothetical protein [Anaerolineales bacterium]